MRKSGCQSRNHFDCHVENQLWECVKCHRKFCYADGGADAFPDYCDDCWHFAVSLQEGFEEKQKADNPDSKSWKEFPVMVRNTANNYANGSAELIVVNGKGYLWIGDSNGFLLGWVSSNQLDAISKEWQELRSEDGIRKQSARFDRIRRKQIRNLKRYVHS